ncbi:MAG: 16S rRNA (adenine(1518)-N(6)/adenine(1519)-N(6))-dimethyltransferase RsmA [Verrucomicrobiota bacterium]
MTLAEIKSVLEEKGLRPLKQLGQNFLFDQNMCQWWVDYVAETLQSTPEIVEIGPGLGSLTKPLLAKGFTVKAIEKDRGLSAYLRESLASVESFTLIEGDALDWLEQEKILPKIVVGNLPYNVTSPLLTMFFKRLQLPQAMFLLVQKEFGDRLAAPSGDKNFGSLSVLFQTFYKIEKAKKVPPQVFYPKPDIDSLFISLRLREDLHLPIAEIPSFEAMVRQAFSQRRKKLKNLLPIQEERRAEELRLEEWVPLYLETKKTA